MELTKGTLMQGMGRLIVGKKLKEEEAMINARENP